MMAEPQKEHHWLQKLVGEWTCETEMVAEPGKPPSKSESVESVRSLGGLWILGESHFKMPSGSLGTAILTLGYDPQKKCYLGTWIGSMMTHMWVYANGSLDATGKILTLNSEGPSMADQTKMSWYQDVIEFVDDDYRTLTSQVQGEDGKWTKFMTAHYRRKK